MFKPLSGARPLHNLSRPSPHTVVDFCSTCIVCRAPSLPTADWGKTLPGFEANFRMRIAVVGGVAGGATFAARMRRLAESAKITLFERGPDVSFA